MKAELGKTPEVNTPEMTGPFVADMYSQAPKSMAAPCGRAFPSKSTVMAETATPASMAGLDDCKWKSYGAVDVLTNIGFEPTWLELILHQAGSSITAVAPWSIF